jgi:hypothetical protein
MRGMVFPRGSLGNLRKRRFPAYHRKEDPAFADFRRGNGKNIPVKQYHVRKIAGPDAARAVFVEV